MATPNVQQDPAEGARDVIDHELARQAAQAGHTILTTETTPRGMQRAKAEDVRRLLLDVDDSTIAAILAAQPSIGELEAAVAWSVGQGDIPDRAGQTLSGKAAAVFEILSTLDNEGDGNAG